MNQIRQLFGTDGIRGVAGEFPLTRDSTYVIGRALGHDLKRSNPNAKVVIGQDTRESSAWIADQVSAGLLSVGVAVKSAGVITTPGIAYLARSRQFDAGVVISASHNPWTDNGIKVFSGTGYKLPDSHELAIEKEIFGLWQGGSPAIENPTGSAAPSVPGDPELRQAYIHWLAGLFKLRWEAYAHLSIARTARLLQRLLNYSEPAVCRQRFCTTRRTGKISMTDAGLFIQRMLRAK